MCGLLVREYGMVVGSGAADTPEADYTGDDEKVSDIWMIGLDSFNGLMK